MKTETRKWLLIAGLTIAVVVLTAAVVINVAMNSRGFFTIGQPHQSADAQIVSDVEQLLAQHLANLGPGDPIFDRYGPFQSISGVQTYRDGPYYQNVVNIDFVATVHFANADARLTLGINHGPTPAITQMVTHPQPHLMDANPSQGWTLQKIDSELCYVNGSGRSPCTLDGWAVHPDFEP